MCEHPACAGGAVRARTPQDYEKTVTNYFALMVRGTKTNVEVGVDKPEPSDCPLDGYITSTRGGVVPVVCATRTDALTGKETIYISAKQYYFWFRGNTIAGVTTRMEQCPGSTTALSEVTQALAAAEASPTPLSPLPTVRQTQSQEGAASTGEVTRGSAQNGSKPSGSFDLLNGADVRDHSDAGKLYDVNWVAWAAERLREQWPRADATSLEKRRWRSGRLCRAAFSANHSER